MGLLGPNGAGKTTAIRILTTILHPDAGSFRVDGIGMGDVTAIRRRIGVLPESSGYPERMTAVEFLVYHGRLYGLGRRAARRKADELMHGVGLGDRARGLISTFSRGMRQRLGLARTLINDPGVLFLDEPTLGLDPKGQEELLRLIRQVADERKVGIVFCSHLLAEVEALCDDILILQDGRTVAQGTVAEIKARSEAGHLQDAFLKLTEQA